MFGELPLIGETSVVVKNNSIQLPNFTMCEHKECLCFLKIDSELRIYSEKEYDKLLDKINISFNNKKSSLKYKYEILRYLCGHGYDETTVKKDKTIKSLKFLKENLELILVGANNHIKILTKEQYRLFKKTN